MPFIHNKKFRDVFIQVVVLAGMLLFLCFIGLNTISNLEKRGISSGFDFLGEVAGFDISMHLIDYDESSTYGRALLVSILNTLLVSVLGVFLASFLGVFFGVARLSSNWLLRKIAGVYIETLRNIPLLLQIFFWYFAVFQTLPHPRKSLALGDSVFLNIRGLFVPEISFHGGTLVWLLGVFFCGFAIKWYGSHWLKNKVEGEVRSPSWFFALMITIIVGACLAAGVGSPVALDKPVLKGFNFQGGWSLIPEFSALLIALSTYTASFIAEIVRAGIQSVTKGQVEAAKALGLSNLQTLKFVILPQALKVIVPPLTSQYLNLVKNSSLASAIAFPDLVLVFAGTTLNQTGQALEVVAITMIFYLLVSLGISLFMNWYNKNRVMVGAA